MLLERTLHWVRELSYDNPNAFRNAILITCYAACHYACIMLLFTMEDIHSKDGYPKHLKQSFQCYDTGLQKFYVKITPA